MLSFISWKEKLRFPKQQVRERNYYTPIRLLQLWTLPFVVAIIYVYHQQYGVSDVLFFFSFFLIVLWIYFYYGIHKCAAMVYIAISMVSVLVGALIMERSVQKELHEKDFFVGAEVRCEGQVEDVVSILHKGEFYQKILFQPTRVSSTKASANVRQEEEGLGRLVLYAKERKEVQEGLFMTIKGKVQPIVYSYEEGAIDIRARYAGEGIVGTVWDPSIESVQKPSSITVGSLCRQMQIHLRHTWEQTILKYVGEEKGTILCALLFGAEYSKLPEEVNDQFATTGLIHILSVSGSHIALLLGLSLAFGKICSLPRRYQYGMSVLVTFFYAGMVGVSSPVIRSSLVGTLCAIGMCEDRPYSALQAVTLVLVGQLVFNPFLVQDISFQLSYGATIGILLFYQAIVERIHIYPKWFRKSLAITVSAQIIVLPFQIYYFHQISWISVVANAVVGVLLELVMVGTLVQLLLTSIVPYLTGIWQFSFSMIGQLLTLTLQVDGFLATLPFAVQEVGQWYYLEYFCYTVGWILVYLYLKRYVPVEHMLAVILGMIFATVAIRMITFRPEVLILSHSRLQFAGVKVEGGKGIFFLGSDFPGRQEGDAKRLEGFFSLHHITEGVVFVETEGEKKELDTYFSNPHRGIKRHIILRKFESLRYSYKGIEIGIQGPIKKAAKQEFSVFSRYVITCQKGQKGLLLHSGQLPEKVVQLKNDIEWITIGVVPSTAKIRAEWLQKGRAYEDPAETDAYIIGKERWQGQFL